MRNPATPLHPSPAPNPDAAPTPVSRVSSKAASPSESARSGQACGDEVGAVACGASVGSRDDGKVGARSRTGARRASIISGHRRFEFECGFGSYLRRGRARGDGARADAPHRAWLPSTQASPAESPPSAAPQPAETAPSSSLPRTSPIASVVAGLRAQPRQNRRRRRDARARHRPAMNGAQESTRCRSSSGLPNARRRRSRIEPCRSPPTSASLRARRQRHRRFRTRPFRSLPKSKRRRWHSRACPRRRGPAPPTAMPEHVPTARPIASRERLRAGGTAQRSRRPSRG